MFIYYYIYAMGQHPIYNCEFVQKPKTEVRIERNTFLNKTTAQFISDTAIKPLAFTGIPTFSLWQLFGKVGLPKVSDFVAKNLPFNVKSPAGQVFVGSALVGHIISVFSILDVVKAGYNSAGKNIFGFKNPQTDSLIAKILETQQKLALLDF